MSMIGKTKYRYYFYESFFLLQLFDLEELLFASPSIETTTPSWLYSILCITSFVLVIEITMWAIENKDQLQSWREIMKNFRYWIFLLITTGAFITLIVEICKHMEDTFDTVRVVVAFSILFLPNIGAFLKIYFSKKQRDD